MFNTGLEYDESYSARVEEKYGHLPAFFAVIAQVQVWSMKVCYRCSDICQGQPDFSPTADGKPTLKTARLDI
jgi:hypothetical protein